MPPGRMSLRERAPGPVPAGRTAVRGRWRHRPAARRLQSPVVDARGAHDLRVEEALHVHEHGLVAILAAGLDVFGRQGGVGLVAHGQQHGVQVVQLIQIHQLLPVFAHGFGRVGLGVMHQRDHIVFLEFADHVHHAGVAQVGHVLLEGEAQDAHARAADHVAVLDQALDQALGHIFAHVVVGAATSQDDFGVEAHLLGLEGQVVGIHADAVAAHQTGTEGQEIPFGTGGFQHFEGVDAQALEDDGQLVHERDVQVALGVLDDLGGLGHLETGGAVDARLDHGAVDLGQQVGRGLVGTGDDLLDGLQGVDLVAGVDAFRRVAHGEVRAVGEAGFLFQDGHADLFGEAGVDRGFIDHHAALGHVTAHGVAGAHHGGEVGGTVFVDGGGHGHDDHGGPGQVGGVAGVLDRGGGQGLVGHFVGAVMAFAQLFDASGVDVETDHVYMAGKSHGQGQAHIAQADNGQGTCPVCEFFQTVHHLSSHRLIRWHFSANVIYLVCYFGN